MKKIRFIQLILLPFLWVGCSEESFDYQMYVPSENEIDSVYFSPGAGMLIADGQATLDFVVEGFRRVRMTHEDGSTVDSMVYIDLTSLPTSAVKVYKASGEECGMSYSTAEHTAGSVTFYAKIGECVSANKTVVLRAKPVLPVKIYVDVIFHVFELKKTDPSYDPLSNQVLDYELVKEALKNMNDVFNNLIGKGPNGASANITFRLAARNAKGVTLAQPGYNRIDFDETTVKPASYGGFGVPSFIEYMNGNASRIWNSQKYLNVVVIPSGANNSMGTDRPQYQIVEFGATAIGGIPNVITDRSQAVYDYKNVCVGVPRTLFFPGVGRKVELCPFVGAFYGLLSTNRKAGVTDYCTDTQLYDGTDQFSELKKVGLNGDKFLANNAMDDNRSPSLRNNLTLDQITRVRSVLTNCPGRDNGLTE